MSLQRQNFAELIRARGGLAETSEQLDRLASVATMVSASAAIVKNGVLLDYVDGDYKEKQAIYLYAVAKLIAGTGLPYGALDMIDPLADHPAGKVQMALAVASLERKGVVATMYDDNKLYTTFPMETVYELETYLAARPPACHPDA